MKKDELKLSTLSHAVSKAEIGLRSHVASLPLILHDTQIWNCVDGVCVSSMAGLKGESKNQR